MGLSKPIAEFDTVKTWGEGLRKQWGGDPLAEEPEMIEALRDFCDFAGEDPDSIIAKLFRIRKEDGERVLSVKWRRHYADKIKEFRTHGDGKNQRRGADVLSFLIHNGVLIQG